MRIIAGECRGRKLRGPAAPGVRPTSDRLRETLFNIVDVERPGCRVLDGFAGTGALGLEALSRGAAHVTFVERDRRAIDVIAANVRTCGAGDRCIIERGDFQDVARRLVHGASFDLVLLDPPYAGVDAGAAVDAAVDVVRPGGLIVLEHARRSGAPPAARARIVREVTSGDSQLTFYLPPAPGGREPR